MTSHALRVLAIAALASGPILGCLSPIFRARVEAPAGAALPAPAPVPLAQSQPTPAAPPRAAPAPATPGLAVRVAPTPAPAQPLGLPRVTDYESIPELRDVHFDFGRAVVRSGDIRILDANAAWLRAHPDHLVLIEGHSDNRGTAKRKQELNIDLGERRAQAVMNHLVARGVHPSRITVLSYGEERPQCIEKSEQCWSRNRRARVLVKPR